MTNNSGVSEYYLFTNDSTNDFLSAFEILFLLLSRGFDDASSVAAAAAGKAAAEYLRLHAFDPPTR